MVQLGRRWKQTRVTMKAAIVAGLMGASGAIGAALVVVFLPMLVARGEKAPQWLKLYPDFVGFADGSGQYPGVGCPNGEFFVAGQEQASLNLPRYPGPLEGFSWLGPLNVVVGVDTNLPAGDYVTVTQVEARIEEYAPEEGPQTVVVRSTACADADPGAEGWTYIVVLDPETRGIELLRPLPGASATGSFVLRQDLWTEIRFEFSARKAGTYRVNIRMDYRYRGTKRSAELPEAILVHFLGRDAAQWMVGSFEVRDELLSMEAAADLKSALPWWSPHDEFPPALAAPTDRSGPAELVEDVTSPSYREP